jgi:lipoprotein-anchoring transpeptidase ErfK/SrfK
MSRKFTLALLASASILCVTINSAAAQSGQPVRMASNMGGGFIEFLFGDPPPGGRYQQPMYQQQPDYYGRSMMPPMDPQQGGMYRQEDAAEPVQRAIDPRYNKQVVDYHGKEDAGTIVIDTPNKFLYLVQGDGKALRYGVGVGRPGFTWSGTKTISAKKEWPAWTPPPEMLARRPDLPRHMVGGPENPLGARAMYLGSTLYRIHGSNEPWTIGTNVSSGCIRMRNDDVIDLYGRVGVGTRVVVM